MSVEAAQFDGMVAGLELGLAIGRESAVEDVFEVEAGVCGDEGAAGIGAVANGGEAGVAGAVVG